MDCPPRQVNSEKIKKELSELYHCDKRKFRLIVKTFDRNLLFLYHSIVLLHQLQNAEVTLHASVVTDVILNHIDEFFLAGKAFLIVPLPFQNAQKPSIGALGDLLLPLSWISPVKYRFFNDSSNCCAHSTERSK